MATGSCVKTSIAAPAMRLFFSVSVSATSCTTGPRDVLMKYAVGFISPNSRAPINPRVVSSSKVLTETKSDSRIIVSMSVIVTPSESTSDWGTFGSQPSKHMSNGCARRRTSEPMLPTPITPSVRPVNPMPRKLPFSAQRFSLTSWSFSNIRCASAKTYAITEEATGRLTPSGVIVSITPASVHAGTSTES